MMAGIPWFAWIAIVAIVVWGIVMVVGVITGRPLPGTGSNANSAEIDQLNNRISELEEKLNRTES